MQGEDVAARGRVLLFSVGKNTDNPQNLVYRPVFVGFNSSLCVAFLTHKISSFKKISLLLTLIVLLLLYLV